MAPSAELLETIANRMIPLSGGTIHLRDDRKAIEWEQELTSFSLARFQVTQHEYAGITGRNPSCFRGEDHPVETVTWWDAIAYCNALSRAAGLSPCYEVTGSTSTWDTAANGYRLPTDAEWEFACRAGTRQVRHGDIDAIAWFTKNSGETTREVGLKTPNDWGLHDMLGNVWEWCWDLYDPEVYGEYRIFRGGGWADRERGCLASNRRRSHPSYAIDDLGFRIARSH